MLQYQSLLSNFTYDSRLMQYTRNAVPWYPTGSCWFMLTRSSCSFEVNPVLPLAGLAHPPARLYCDRILTMGLLGRREGRCRSRESTYHFQEEPLPHPHERREHLYKRATFAGAKVSGESWTLQIFRNEPRYPIPWFGSPFLPNQDSDLGLPDLWLGV